jgi:hypothetical protein
MDSPQSNCSGISDRSEGDCHLRGNKRD